MTPAARLWARVAAGTACAGVLLAFVRPPTRGGWPVLAALPLGLVAGTLLFLAVERRPPALPRPSVTGADVWLAKHAVLAVWAGVEEVVWRWTVLGQLARVVPAVAALAAASLAFAFWHRPTAPEHVLAGLVFGGLFVGTGSLAAAWAAHVAYNGSVAAAGESVRARAAGTPP